MSVLDDLLSSLVSSIVKYHKKKLPTAPVVDQDLLKYPTAEMIIHLTVLINAATNNIDTRKPLLRYILTVIASLKKYLDNHEPTLPEEDDALITQLTQFIEDIKTLLKTNQAYQITVNFDSTENKLFGLHQGVWPVSTLSDSGMILSALITDTVNLKDLNKDQTHSFFLTVFETQRSTRLITALTVENAILRAATTWSKKPILQFFQRPLTLSDALAPLVTKKDASTQIGPDDDIGNTPSKSFK